MIFEKLVAVLADHVDCDPSSVTMDTTFEELGVDSLDTVDMVMELEEAEKFCKANPMIDAYFIYSGENGEFKTYYTDGMKRYMPDAK